MANHNSPTPNEQAKNRDQTPEAAETAGPNARLNAAVTASENAVGASGAPSVPGRDRTEHTPQSRH